MHNYVRHFEELERSMIKDAGGKGANLGELARIKGIDVPDGFCITTKSYKKITASNAALQNLLDLLSRYDLPRERADGSQKVPAIQTISPLTSKIRVLIEALPLDDEIEKEIAKHLQKFSSQQAFAVRSSATAEDLPAASFAGQQDTYLNIIGKDSILKYIRKCQASLFTDRAVIYRIRNKFDHNKVQLAVIVQQMIFPTVSGTMFTADPVTSNRKVLSIDASFGLGEALVSGLVNPDNYKVKTGIITEKKIARKKVAISPSKDGGTIQQELSTDQQNIAALTDQQVLQLESIGRAIEDHFGSPQDIEWCLDNDKFYIVQSRPVTTLYPVPEPKDNKEHIYISVGHNQMMTDAMKPFGLSFFQGSIMYRAGGRPFVDVAAHFSTAEGSKLIIERFGRTDELIKDALITMAERKGFNNLINDDPDSTQVLPGNDQTNESDPLSKAPSEPVYSVKDMEEFIQKCVSAIKTLNETIQSKSGTDLIDFILEDKDRLMKSFFDQKNLGMILSAMDAYTWINTNISNWLREENAAHILSQSVSNNITSEMGMELSDVADIIRPFPEVIEFLQAIKDENFMDELSRYTGGIEAREAITKFLRKFGMRCPGEIDITRPRWIEQPSAIIPIIISNIKNLNHGAAKQKFEIGLVEAMNKEKDLLIRLKQLPGGGVKARQTKQQIDLIRELSGYREYPKYIIVGHYLEYRQALLKEADRLTKENILIEPHDFYYLYVDEVRELLRSGVADYALISKRKEEFTTFEKLIPPRVMTSDGEIIAGRYKRKNLPPGALAGLAVSSGITEGRARVVLNLVDADFEDGDILVTTFTDPSWTPLFLSIKGLITEVGGLMTHGAVVAREYGLPAVVGIENATTLIKDGQRIRLNGIDGFVEIL